MSEDNLAPPIPAATVVILKDFGAAAGVEVLMLRKNSKIAFGGMWVFPGGRIDPEDYPADGDVDIAARNAAARETMEEAGLTATADDFVLFAHWTPPATTPKRFATWFFATRTLIDEPIQIDGGEILDHLWINPADALAKHKAGEIDLAPPTWITLYQLALHGSGQEIIAHFDSKPHKVYQTRVVKDAQGVRVALWQGDAGYESSDADVEGERHRLVLAETGFAFENTAEIY
ncbi:NUDIX hydrolase [Pseudomonadales bacterium]|nr:NUDIX hydrolase [Pseudomonadales bacterium]MDB9942395.1 NUDIX hydrolase [Pseudomonadales bacterium]